MIYNTSPKKQTEYVMHEHTKMVQEVTKWWTKCLQSQITENKCLDSSRTHGDELSSLMWGTGWPEGLRTKCALLMI